MSVKHFSSYKPVDDLNREFLCDGFSMTVQKMWLYGCFQVPHLSLVYVNSIEVKTLMRKQLLKQRFDEIGILCDEAPPHSFWVQHHCCKFKSQACKDLSGVI